MRNLENIRQIFDQFDGHLRMLNRSVLNPGFPIQDEDVAEIHSHAANYLCILVSGALETDVIQILADYIGRSRSDAAKGRFLDEAKKKLPSPTIGGIKRVTRDVNQAWENHIENLLGEHSRSEESIESLNNNRNSIAHGREVKHLTMRHIKDYLKSIREFLDQFNEIVR